MRLRTLLAAINLLVIKEDNDVLPLEVCVEIHGSRRPTKSVRIENIPLTVAEAANNKKPKQRIVIS